MSALTAWAGPAVIALVFVALGAWSWEKWADVHIDFGNDLYVAWRLWSGDALYRDIAHRGGPLAHRGGPLAHHLNAAWFGLFGVSVRTLVLCNLAVLAGICALTWRVFRVGCGRVTATATVLVLLCVFAFAQYTGIGNYNYVTPYHHHQTHGLALSLAMIVALGEALRRAPVRWCAVAGACLGGVFLTKAELFVPAALVAALGLLFVGWAGGEGRGRAFAAFGAAALLLPAGFFVALAARMPTAVALEGVLGNWAHLGAGLLGDAFYARGAGLDDVSGNLAAAGTSFGAIALFAAAVLGVDRLVPPGRARLPAALAGAAALFAALVRWPDAVPWFGIARALPLTAGLACAGLVVVCARRRGDRDGLARVAPLALYALLAVALLGKMLLRARFEQYGFVLAMPATLLLVATLLNLLPAWWTPQRGVIARTLVAGVVAAGCVFFLGQTSELHRRKTFAIGEGGDRMLAPSPFTSRRPRVLADALGRLETLAPADSTLLVLPEGASLNYWLRKRNPSRHLLFLPTEIAAFGEDAMLADFEAHPADWVALVHRDAAEFGVGPFGRDPRNGRRLLEWVDRHYERVARLGAEPFGDEGFGVVLLRRRDAAP